MSELPYRPESPGHLREKFSELRQAAAALRRLPNAKLFCLLDEVGRLWQPGSEYFQQARRLLAGTFSEATVHAALQNLSLSLTGQVVEAELNRELGRADLLETWRPDERLIGYVRGYPLGVAAQVLAGNVFLNGVVGLSQCLLTRNAALLKLSQKDSGLTSLFVRSIEEADREGVISQAIAVCAWDRNREEFHQVLREEADAIVVWGGESAIAAYPREACRGRVIHHGPRLGIGIVLDGFDLSEGVSQLAWDVALWEQRACSSPRILFVEDREGTGDFPRQIAQGLSAALSQIRATIPAPLLSLDDKSEVLSIREFADWQQHAEVFHQRESMDHTVLLLREEPTEVPVGFRTVMVVPLRRIEDIPACLSAYRSVLQTAVLAAPPSRWNTAIEQLVVSGISQVVAPGSAASRFLGLPHEGEFALSGGWFISSAWIWESGR